MNQELIGMALVEAWGLPQGVIMRVGTTSDLDEMLALEQASFTAPWTRKMFEGELSGNPFSRFLLIRTGSMEEPGALAAYLCYWVVFDELRLMNLAVSPAWRRKGLATALVRQAVREALQVEGKRALLEVRASNAAARGLYGRLGFRETGIRRDYYVNPPEDAVLMAMEPLTELRKEASAG